MKREDRKLKNQCSILRNSAFLITISPFHVKCKTLNEKFSTYLPTCTKIHKAVPKYLKHVYQFLNHVQKTLSKLRFGHRPFFLHIKWEQESPQNIKKALKIFPPPYTSEHVFFFCSGIPSRHCLFSIKKKLKSQQHSLDQLY